MCNQPSCGYFDIANKFSEIKHIMKQIVDVQYQYFNKLYIHLGFDEVNKNCKEAAGDNSVKYANWLIEYCISKGLKCILWIDFILNINFDEKGNYINKVNLKKFKNKVVLQIWNLDEEGNELFVKKLKELSKLGIEFINSFHKYFYLDCGYGSWLWGQQMESKKTLKDGGFKGESWCGHKKTWEKIYQYNISRLDYIDREKGVIKREFLPKVIGGEVLFMG